MKKISLIKPYLDIKEQSAVHECIKSGWLSFRGKYVKKLQAKNIETRPGFFPISLMKPFINYSKNQCRNSIQLSESTICLPSSYNLTLKQQKYITNSLLKILS